MRMIGQVAHNIDTIFMDEERNIYKDSTHIILAYIFTNAMMDSNL